MPLEARWIVLGKHLLIGAALVLVLPSAARAQGPCAPSHEAGWVGRVDLVPNRQDAPSPHIIRGSASLPVVEGEALCANDLVRNPAGSTRRIWLRVNALGSRELAPARDFLVPEPDWMSRLQAFLTPFNNFLGRSRRSLQPASVASTRGNEGCSFAPANGDLNSNVVAEWGPIYLSWPCAPDQMGPWNVQIISSAGSRSVTALDNMVRIDPRGCLDSCILRVTQQVTNAEALTLHVLIVPAASAPLPSVLRRRPLDSVQRAMIGASMTGGRQRGWQLQGMSLLWQAGCDVPAAGQLAAQDYGANRMEAVCELR
jgi:hypothetical protein